MGKIKNRFEKILKKNHVGKIYLYIDTSGSVEIEKEYEYPLKEVIETVVEKGLPLSVNLFTHELYLSTEFFGMKKDELYDAILNLDIQYGGTDFTDVYTDIMRHFRGNQHGLYLILSDFEVLYPNDDRCNFIEWPELLKRIYHMESASSDLNKGVTSRGYTRFYDEFLKTNDEGPRIIPFAANDEDAYKAAPAYIYENDAIPTSGKPKVKVKYPERAQYALWTNELKAQLLLVAYSVSKNGNVCGYYKFRDDNRVSVYHWMNNDEKESFWNSLTPNIAIKVQDIHEVARMDFT